MAPIRLVSERQLEILVEFAETHRNIALNINKTGPLGQRETEKAWEEVAKKLNAVSDGITKSTLLWKRYWHTLKCRTKQKAADNRRSVAVVGSGANKLVPLTDIEKRVTCITGKFVEGAPTVRTHSVGAGPSQKRNVNSNVPRWVLELEERHIAADERLADGIAGLATTNESILECLQHMATSQAQLVQLLAEMLQRQPPQ